ncbi:PREDICTED: N-glycosylase/DNA lyase isoform X1 [Polistes canadensis]|uniref:N-glycosylase/DNA lyase isoform X1 n=1 Tax=Polistes canadensis TaxID=91411 RepID=UPI000718B896|nr:PREDICTED: N-glycosylase/DNA lyase isoform X1 [Polistes canadensis]
MFKKFISKKMIECSSKELNLGITLQGGQSFRWFPYETGYRGVFNSSVWSLTQNDTCISYTVHGSLSDDHNYDEILRRYFRLDISLLDHCKKWTEVDKHFQKSSDKVDGVRILNQDVLENLFAFICSSNNNIQRISGMVEKLCILFGKKICSIDGKDYFDFPTLELLQGDNVESILRKEGFGYRAAYIANTAKKLQELGGKKWLLSLCKCNSTLSYFEAKEQLLILPGVGPKVADCVCLMSLGYLEAIPVDTHIFQVARDNYLPHLGKQKTVTPKINEEINKYLRELWGPLAGWAQAVLFCAKIGDNTKNILNKKRSKTESEVKTKKKIRKVLTN